MFSKIISINIIIYPIPVKIGLAKINSENSLLNLNNAFYYFVLHFLKNSGYDILNAKKHPIVVRFEQKNQNLLSDLNNIFNTDFSTANEIIKNLDYDKKIISKDDVLEIMEVIQSYVFRRQIAGVGSHGHNRTFSRLHSYVNVDKPETYVETVKAVLALKHGYERFPDDIEFATAFIDSTASST